MIWWKGLKGKVIRDEPLKKHTSFKIGGRAKFFILPRDTGDLKLLINYSNRYNMPVLVIGAGSNILVNDKGVEAIVLNLGSAPFKKISCKGNSIEAGSAVTLWQLVKSAFRNGLSGAEFLSGIPGTLGGALAMNAGQAGKGICNLVETVNVMDYNGEIKTLSKKDLICGYRKSNLGKYIILKVRLKLRKKSKKEIRYIIEGYTKYRRNTQNTALPNAGCMFKNPPGKSAGKLIDLCGLKGKTQGGAYISNKHANFILNRGDARSSDVLKLMALVKKRVKHKFNINLEPEIKIWQ
jgi:UDP-N-acetylmuramate dehydrogenase